MNKLTYTKPEIEIVEFNAEDIMTASTNQYDDEGILDKEATKWWE